MYRLTPNISKYTTEMRGRFPPRAQVISNPGVGFFSFTIATHGTVLAYDTLPLNKKKRPVLVRIIPWNAQRNGYCCCCSIPYHCFCQYVFVKNKTPPQNRFNLHSTPSPVLKYQNEYKTSPTPLQPPHRAIFSRYHGCTVYVTSFLVVKFMFDSFSYYFLQKEANRITPYGVRNYII
jgi:hypothetical protein